MPGDLDCEAGANGQFYKDRLLHADSLSGQHRPLFRLLYIEPGHFGEAIKGSLKTCELESTPTYKALSYSWGEKAGLEIIHLDGGFHFRVRRNLEDALQRLRHPSDTVCVWIDGICINQADTSERSSQVRQMGEIYSRADEVLVWLGETRALRGAELAMYGNAIGLVQRGDKVWWKRLWVVQESTSARKRPRVLFGHSSMDWKPFLDQWRELCVCTRTTTATTEKSEIQSPESEFFDDGLAALQMLGDLWKIGPGRSSLYEMLVRTQSYVCSDDHDRIYALLHLLQEADQRIFAPDYDSPLQQLYAQATAHFIKTEPKGFDVLLRHWHRGCETWPHAWWLDFTRPLPQHCYQNTMPFLFSRQKASLSMQPVIEMAIYRAESSNLEMPSTLIQPRLHAKGFLLDEIDMTRPFRSLFNPKTGNFEILKWIGFFKHIRIREKAGFLHYFTHRRDKRGMTLSKKQSTSIIPPRMRAIRLGLLKSLLALFRTYAESLSSRMKRTLNLFEAVPEDVLRPTTEDLDAPDEEMVQRLDKEVIEHLGFLMKQTLRLLANYDIFITTHGYVGFSRSTPHDSKTHQAEFRSAQPRDLVVVLQGGSFPFVLRHPEYEDTAPFVERLATWDWSRKEAAPVFSIADGCCVPAIMGGELAELAQKNEVQAQSFTLGEPIRRSRSRSRDVSPGATSYDGSSTTS